MNQCDTVIWMKINLDHFSSRENQIEPSSTGTREIKKNVLTDLCVLLNDYIK